jgi:hypothetical protein
VGSRGGSSGSEAARDGGREALRWLGSSAAAGESARARGGEGGGAWEPAGCRRGEAGRELAEGRENEWEGEGEGEVGC